MKHFEHFRVNDVICEDINSVLTEIGMSDCDIESGNASRTYEDELNCRLNDTYYVEICGTSYDAYEIMSELYKDDLEEWYTSELEEAQSNIKDALEEMMDKDEDNLDDCDEYSDNIDFEFGNFDVSAVYEDDTPEQETIPVIGYVAMHGCELLLSGLHSNLTYDEILQIKHSFITSVLENHGLIAINFHSDKQEQVFNSLGYSFVIISDTVLIPNKGQHEEA